MSLPLLLPLLTSLTIPPPPAPPRPPAAACRIDIAQRQADWGTTEEELTGCKGTLDSCWTASHNQQVGASECVHACICAVVLLRAAAVQLPACLPAWLSTG